MYIVDTNYFVFVEAVRGKNRDLAVPAVRLFVFPKIPTLLGTFTVHLALVLPN